MGIWALPGVFTLIIPLGALFSSPKGCLVKKKNKTTRGYIMGPHGGFYLYYKIYTRSFFDQQFFFFFSNENQSFVRIILYFMILRKYINFVLRGWVVTRSARVYYIVSWVSSRSLSLLASPPGPLLMSLALLPRERETKFSGRRL